MKYIDEKSAPELTDLLNDFSDISKHILEGDTLVLRIANNYASIELITDGYSVYKQEKKFTESVKMASMEN